MFPKGQVQGVAKARAFFKENPDAFGVVRDDVMKVMLQTQLELEAKRSTNGTPGNE